MLFSTYGFLFVFLPATIAVYAAGSYIFDGRYNAIVLLGASLIFYGYFRIDYLVIIILSIIINFKLGSIIIHSKEENNKNIVAFCGIFLNLALLGYFKYKVFFVNQVDALFGFEHSVMIVVLPLGISFFTFQQIAYLADARKGRVHRESIIDYALFVTFFPQLIAGPIVHHKEMMPQFSGQKRIVLENIAVGLSIFAIGLFKKTVIADNVGGYTTPFESANLAGTVTFVEAWAACLAYTFQIYFDFSAYSDMAIGLARIFGIVLPVNFLSPYKSRNIAQFWQRWHITLSRFLRDYLYIPLGGNRCGKLRVYANLMITMVLGGLWHGAGWQFILWGALHGLFLAVHRIWSESRLARTIAIPKPIAVAMTFLVVTIAWVPFRATDVATALTMYEAMAGLNGIAIPAEYASLLISVQPLLDLFSVTYVGQRFQFEGIDQLGYYALLLAIVWFAPNVVEIFSCYRPALLPETYAISESRIRWVPSLGWSFGIGIMACLGIAGSNRIMEFIYFQF